MLILSNSLIKRSTRPQKIVCTLMSFAPPDMLIRSSLSLSGFMAEPLPMARDKPMLQDRNYILTMFRWSC